MIKSQDGNGLYGPSRVDEVVHVGEIVVAHLDADSLCVREQTHDVEAGKVNVYDGAALRGHGSIVQHRSDKRGLDDLEWKKFFMIFYPRG